MSTFVGPSHVALFVPSKMRNGCYRSVSLCLLSGGAAAAAFCLSPAACRAQSADAEILGFTKKHCVSCHNAVDREGGLDLTKVEYAPGDSENFDIWVKIHDRVQSGEMPP